MRCSNGINVEWHDTAGCYEPYPESTQRSIRQRPCRLIHYRFGPRMSTDLEQEPASVWGAEGAWEAMKNGRCERAAALAAILLLAHGHHLLACIAATSVKVATMPSHTRRIIIANAPGESLTECDIDESTRPGNDGAPTFDHMLPSKGILLERSTSRSCRRETAWHRSKNAATRYWCGKEGCGKVASYGNKRSSSSFQWESSWHRWAALILPVILFYHLRGTSGK